MSTKQGPSYLKTQILEPLSFLKPISRDFTFNSFCRTKRKTCISVQSTQFDPMASGSRKSTLSKLSIQWEWEGDKGLWQQYASDIQAQISRAFDAGRDEVANPQCCSRHFVFLQVLIEQTDEVSMTVKFADMIQINQKTKFMRRIRLCIELKDSNGFFAYEYENDKKKWIIYNAQIVAQIARAVQNDQTVLAVEYRNQSYTIDLDQLTETNTQTEATRNIRSVESSSCDSRRAPHHSSCCSSGQAPTERLHGIEQTVSGQR